ncbi:hypothetical protein SPJ2_1329 [Streptococcus parauberis KRS-02109]|nr:hypothetical protein SPJ2_1329 [Streptococcus parauberis KRS-02109]
MILGFIDAENENLISLMSSELLINKESIYYFYNDGKFLYAKNSKTW